MGEGAQVKSMLTNGLNSKGREKVRAVVLGNGTSAQRKSGPKERRLRSKMGGGKKCSVGRESTKEGVCG